MPCFRLPLLILCFLGWLVFPTARALDTDKQKHVLILYGERLDLPAIRILEQTFRERFGAQTAPSIDWFSEYFDFARFPAAQSDATLTRYIHERYAGQKIDLVLPVTVLSLDFVLRHREELFPGVPVVFLVLNPKDVNPEKLPPDVTGVAGHQDIAGTVDLALCLQPETKEIVVVTGSAELDKKVFQQARPVLDGLNPKIKWRAVAERSLPETIEAVRQVPKDDVVLFLTMLRDSEGRSLTLPEVARQLVPVSPAPIYGLTGTLMGTGVVGGALNDFATLGNQTSDLALKVLHGEKVPYGSGPTEVRNPLMIDWRALQHWNLPLTRVPKDAAVLFRKPTLWEEHRGIIVGIVLVCLAQSITIAGLLIQRSRRQSSEASLSESETRMSLATQSAHFGLWIRDLVTGEVVATTKAREILGFATDAPVTFESFSACLHPEDLETMRQTVDLAIKKKTLYEIEFRVTPPGGSERWINATGQAQYDKKGKPTRTLGVILDVTERRRAGQEVQDLRRELARVDRVNMLGQLASALAHELSQPLGAILRNAEAAELFLKMSPPDLEEIMAILGDIRKDDQRAGQVIDRMRSLMRKRVVEPQTLEVSPLVEDVISLVRADALTRQITIQAKIPENLSPVCVDRVQFQQVLLNLLLNAMDAITGASQGERNITVTAHGEGANLVEITVRDTGPGVPTDRLEKLFEPFFTTKPQGLGVGLAICRSILEAQGGRIWAENHANGGAFFHVTLPIAHVEKPS